MLDPLLLDYLDREARPMPLNPNPANVADLIRNAGDAEENQKAAARAAADASAALTAAIAEEKDADTALAGSLAKSGPVFLGDNASDTITVYYPDGSDVGYHHEDIHAAGSVSLDGTPTPGPEPTPTPEPNPNPEPTPAPEPSPGPQPIPG